MDGKSRYIAWDKVEARRKASVLEAPWTPSGFGELGHDLLLMTWQLERCNVWWDAPANSSTAFAFYICTSSCAEVNSPGGGSGAIGAENLGMTGIGSALNDAKGCGGLVKLGCGCSLCEAL